MKIVIIILKNYNNNTFVQCLLHKMRLGRESSTSASDSNSFKYYANELKRRIV